MSMRANHIMLIAMLGMSEMPLVLEPRRGKGRRTEFYCENCDKEIPPGRDGRRCRVCRGLERKAA